MLLNVFKIYRSKKIWVPSLSVAFRLLLLARFCAAMYSNIQDCDEGEIDLCYCASPRSCLSLIHPVYNYWEPLHYLQFGSGFQTWETSPKYSIRSWAYILLHYPLAISTRFLAGGDKVRLFRLLTNPEIVSPSPAAKGLSDGPNYIGRVQLILRSQILSKCGGAAQ